MAVCNKCGITVDGGIKFCPQCGAEIVASPAQENVNTEEKESFADKVKGINDTPDTTADFEAKDIQDNKTISFLSYLGPLVFVPMFARKRSKFARFHANQGLVLFIADADYVVVQNILLAILRAIFPWNWNYGYLGGRGFVFDMLSTILGLVWIVFGVLAVIGIINALKGKAKELPFIGKIKLLK